MENGLTSREDVVNQALQLLLIDLRHLESSSLQLLDQVPMQESKALINDIAIELAIIVIIHFEIVNSKELGVKLLQFLLFIWEISRVIHECDLFVALVLPAKSLLDITKTYSRLLIVVVVMSAPIRLIEWDSMELNFGKLSIKLNKSFKSF